MTEYARDQYNVLVALAQGVATGAHAGQYDKAGHPYIGHPKRIAAYFHARGKQTETIVGMLHDVLEDTDVTAADLRDLYIPEPIVEAVEAITHRPHEPLPAYYARVKANPVALEVKFADIADNTDPGRLDQLAHTTAERLRAKYATALEALSS